MDKDPTDEAERIRRVYRARHAKHEGEERFFGYENLVHVYRVHNRYEETMRLLKSHGYHPLAGLRILSVGCGSGRDLRQLVDWGAAPGRLAGIDLVESSIETARELSPNIDFRIGDAREMPWPDEEFDIVSQSTVFSSILDRRVRQSVADQMFRVLKPGGAVLWYDAFYNNPANPNFNGIKAAEIRELFPGLVPYLRRLTLAAPLARQLPNALVPVLYPLFERMAFLRTHYLGLLLKPRRAGINGSPETSH